MVLPTDPPLGGLWYEQYYHYTSLGEPDGKRRCGGWRLTTDLLFGPVMLPLPPHFIQRGGYILRPGFAACFTLENPVPLHPSHFRSVGGDVFLIRKP
jgi:hypothetical protein